MTPTLDLHSNFFHKPRIADQQLFAGYKIINFRIVNGSEVPKFSATNISYAVAQALGIWSAWTPLVFRRMYVTTPGDMAIGFYPDQPGGALATGS